MPAAHEEAEAQGEKASPKITQGIFEMAEARLRAFFGAGVPGAQ